jgi:hypothetical protein
VAGAGAGADDAALGGAEAHPAPKAAAAIATATKRLATGLIVATLAGAADIDPPCRNLVILADARPPEPPVNTDALA